MNATIECFENNTIVEFPYIYYPGYVINMNGKKQECFESENGFLAISLDKCPKSKITIEYTGTNLMLISKMITVTTCLFVMILNIKKIFKN